MEVAFSTAEPGGSGGAPAAEMDRLFKHEQRAIVADTWAQDRQGLNAAADATAVRRSLSDPPNSAWGQQQSPRSTEAWRQRMQRPTRSQTLPPTPPGRAATTIYDEGTNKPPPTE